MKASTTKQTKTQTTKDSKDGISNTPSSEQEMEDVQQRPNFIFIVLVFIIVSATVFGFFYSIRELER
jgi:hypothetical protein